MTTERLHLITPKNCSVELENTTVAIAKFYVAIILNAEDWVIYIKLKLLKSCTKLGLDKILICAH